MRDSSLPAMWSCVIARALGERFGEGDSDRSADRIEDGDRAVGHRDRAAAHVDDVEHHGALADLVLAPSRLATRALHDDGAHSCRR